MSLAPSSSSTPSSPPLSSPTASAKTSWLSNMVRVGSDKAGSFKLSNGGSGEGPIKGKSQFRGVLFKYGPKPIQVAFKTGDYKQQVIFIGGLTDGFVATEYLEPLAFALEKKNGRLFNYSCLLRTVDMDGLELDQLINHLINKENSEAVVLLGHSTGCQDIVHYMRTSAACSLAVRAVILQAPVSDREYRATLPETAAMIDLASSMIKEGRGDELLPKEADESAPITAYRYHSLCAYMGDDDMFSSDLSDDQLKTRLGHMSNVPCQTQAYYKVDNKDFRHDVLEQLLGPKIPFRMVIYSMADEYVPEYVDKTALADRLCRAMGGAEKVEIELGNHCLSNRVAEVVHIIVGFIKREGHKDFDDPWN